MTTRRSLCPRKPILYRDESSDDEDGDNGNNSENSKLNGVVVPRVSRKRSGMLDQPVSNKRSANRLQNSKSSASRQEEEEEVSTGTGGTSTVTAAAGASPNSAVLPASHDDDDDDDKEWDALLESEEQDDDDDDDDFQNDTRSYALAAEEEDDVDRKPAAQEKPQETRASENRSARVERHEPKPRMPETVDLSFYLEGKKPVASSDSSATNPTPEDKITHSYQYDLFDYFEHWTSPVTRGGKRLPDGAKSLYNTWDVDKLRARRKELQDANLYMTRVSPMQREGVDWLCDVLTTLFLPDGVAKGDTLTDYNEDHHLSMKALLGHPTMKGNRAALLYPNHMRVHRYLFQAFPQFPWTQSLARALLAFVNMTNLGRMYRGWTREKSKEFMMADGFGPALEAARKVLPYTFRMDDSEEPREGIHKPHSGDEVLELLRHFARVWSKHRKNPRMYPDRPMLTENELLIVDAAGGQSSTETLIRAHAKAEEINWDPVADQKLPKKPYYAKIERLRATFSPALKHVYRLRDVWLENIKNGLPTMMTDAEQQMFRAFWKGNRQKGSLDERKKQVDETAKALGWDPTIDKGKPKSIYRTNIQVRADSRDDIENLLLRHVSCCYYSKTGNTAKVNEFSFTNSEVQIIYAGGMRNGSDNSKDGKLARSRAKAQELGWSVEADKDSPRTKAGDIPRRRRVRYMCHVETGQLGTVSGGNYITMDDGSPTQKLNSKWKEIGDYYRPVANDNKMY